MLVIVSFLPNPTGQLGHSVLKKKIKIKKIKAPMFHFSFQLCCSSLSQVHLTEFTALHEVSCKYLSVYLLAADTQRFGNHLNKLAISQRDLGSCGYNSHFSSQIFTQHLKSKHSNPLLAEEKYGSSLIKKPQDQVRKLFGGIMETN